MGSRRPGEGGSKGGKADMLVRYKAGKNHFEVMAKEGMVTKYREGDLKNLDDVLVTDIIFTNQSKGEKASSEQLRSAFDTEDIRVCLEKIITKGEYQLSAGERKAKVEAKRRMIIEYFRKNYAEPRTKRPIPITRIENALVEAKIRVDPDQPADRQAQEITSKLTAIMPMTKMTLDGTITLPHASAGAAAGIIGKYCKVVKDGYTAEGSSLQVSVAPGDYDDLINDLTKVTKGNFTFEVEGQAAAMASGNEPTKTKPTGGKKGKKRG